MKRVLSCFLSLLVLACLFVLPAGASGVNLVKKECPECGLSSFPSKSEQVGMFVVYTFECENGHTYTYKFIPGVTDKGGTTRGGGAGRQDSPSGYTSDGVPSVNNAGLLTWQPTWPDNVLNLFYYGYSSSTSDSTPLVTSVGDNYYFKPSYVYPSYSNSVYSTRLLLNFYPDSGSGSGNLKDTFRYYFLSSRNLSFTAPVTGFYSCNSILSTVSLSGYSAYSNGFQNPFSLSKKNFYYNRTRRHYSAGDKISMNYYISPTALILSDTEKISWVYLKYLETIVYSPIFQIEPDSVVLGKQTSVTINNNTWNGNIYQDASTNLIYIYPQYTTINENNETVTNISENPIIYNSETNQYYTYDSVTNNYYYITYEQPSTPTPVPSTSPDPGASPTPTPAPGGDSGSTSGILDILVSIKDNMIQGFADLSASFKLAIENLSININNTINKKFPDKSTPETAQPTSTPAPTASPEPSATPEPSARPTLTPSPSPAPGDDDSSTGLMDMLQNILTSIAQGFSDLIDTIKDLFKQTFPDFSGSSGSIGSFGNPLKWLTDLLKDVVEGILKGIWKLITAIFSFILWLLSLLFSLFPWMPNSGVLALCAGVVVVTVIRIVKFILGR